MRDGDFLVRGKEISRVEGLSDAVFGFAITLLAISLEVPKTSHDVLHALHGVLAFAVTFFMLFNLWRMQFTFFRRYGIEDTKIVILTAVLLFVLLIFVYPLRFIMGYLADGLLVKAGFPDPTFNAPAMMPEADVPPLFLAFGLGFAAVFTVFSLMYRHAYSLREELHLNDVEIFDTQEFIQVSTKVSCVGLGLALTYFSMMLVPAHSSQTLLGGTGLVMVLMMFVFRQRRTRKRRRQMVRQQMQQGVEA
jgi:low temperature requirement protein LtrA